jgi:GGDEF domain-containing protein
VVIILITLEGGEDTPARALAAAMGRVKNRMLGGLLRKSDTVARYAHNQFLVMLSMEKPQSARMIMERIRRQCTDDMADGISLEVSFTGMEPAG